MFAADTQYVPADATKNFRCHQNAIRNPHAGQGKGGKGEGAVEGAGERRKETYLEKEPASVCTVRMQRTASQFIIVDVTVTRAMCRRADLPVHAHTNAHAHKHMN